jgi:hypothetical protein
VKTRAIAAILVLLLLAGCGGIQAGQDSGSQSTPRAPGTTTAEAEETASQPPGLRTVTIDASGGEKVEVRVEIADGILEQSRGLMDRTALGEDRGMLFVFPREQLRTFWMRNTLIPLSIAYIDAEGRITDILDMKPLDDEPPHYVSSEPVRYALEVNRGFFEERGVKVGDHADLPDPAS